MSHYEAGPLAGYNSLQDPHLSAYHANTQIRKHLVKSGLVTKHGNIVSENHYRLQMAKKEHRKNVKDMLATAIVHKALDMERMRQYEIRKRLDELYRIDVVQRVRSERSKKNDQELLAVLSPRSASERKKSRRKARKQEHDTLASATKLPSIRPDEKSARVKSYIESTTSSAAGEGSTQQTFQPRPPKSRSKRTKGTAQHRNEPPIAHKIQLQSMAEVTMKFLGSPLNLATDMFPMNRLHEVTILQQHSGGSTLCVFREMLPPNTVFTFISRRHRGAPFGLTMNIGNICNARLSTCCEYKHKPGFKVGGKHSQFALISVHGAAPCYRCQIRLNMVEPNQTKNNDAQHSDESDAESAVRSYDVIVSRNAQYPQSPTPSQKEKEPSRPMSASAATQTTDNEEEKEKISKTSHSEGEADEFELPDQDKYSSGSSDEESDDYSDEEELDEEALSRTEEDGGSGSETESESEEDDIDEKDAVSVSESQTETETTSEVVKVEAASDEEEEDTKLSSRSSSESDVEADELKVDDEDDPSGSALLAEPVDALEERPGSAMVAEAVIATTEDETALSEKEEESDVKEDDMDAKEDGTDTKEDTDEQTYDEAFEKGTSSDNESDHEKEEEKKDEVDGEVVPAEEEKAEVTTDDAAEESDLQKDDEPVPEKNDVDSPVEKAVEIEIVAESSPLESSAPDRTESSSDEHKSADEKAAEEEADATIKKDRPSSGILSNSRPSSSRPGSSGSKKNVTFKEEIKVETYEKVDVPTMTTVSMDDYSEDDNGVADLPEDSSDELGDEFAGERIVVLQDLADSTDDEALSRSGEEQTTDEDEKDVHSTEAEKTEIEVQITDAGEKDTNEPEEAEPTASEETKEEEATASDETKEEEEATETADAQGIFNYGQLHYSSSLELVKPDDAEGTVKEVEVEATESAQDEVVESATESVLEETPIEETAVTVEESTPKDSTDITTEETKESTSEETDSEMEAVVDAVVEAAVEAAVKQSTTEVTTESSQEETLDGTQEEAKQTEEGASNTEQIESDSHRESILSDEGKEKDASILSDSILSDAISIIEKSKSEDVQAEPVEEPTVEEEEAGIESAQDNEEQEAVTSASEPVTSDSEAEAATFDHGYEQKPTPDEYEMKREKSSDNLRSLIKSVKEVELESVELSVEQTRELAEFLYAEADEIESLSLRNTTLSGISREIFEKVEGLSKLKMLNLNMCNLKSADMRYLYDVIASASEDCHIQMLLLHGNPLGDAGIETLTDALMKNKSITSLNIGGCSISDDGMVKLSEWLSNATTLTDLTLSENISVGKLGWQALALALEKNRSLETLAVDFCELKDDGCTVLSTGIAKSVLKSLDIEGNQITDQAGESLCDAIKSCATLRDVTLTPQNQFTEEMEEKMRQVLKDK